MTRPTGFAPLTFTMCVLNPAGLLFFEGSGVPRAIWIPAALSVILFSYVVLWFFWKGRNWARWLVLITSGLAVFNLMLLPTVSTLQRVVIVVEATVGAALLFWLNTPAVRGFFIRKSIDAAA